MTDKNENEHPEDTNDPSFVHDDFSDLDDLTNTDENFELDDESLQFDDENHTLGTQEEQEEVLPAEEEHTPPITPVQPLPATYPPIEEQKIPFSPQTIPISLNVELGRVQISMEKLLHLEPGNLLELDFHPENGVHLVVNGKVIGKGELVRINDAIGIRILDLGH